MPIAIAILALITLLCSGAGAQEATLQLSDGRTVSGDILSDDHADPLRIRVQRGTMRAVLSIPREDIVSIEAGLSERQRAVRATRERLDLLTNIPMVDPQAWWTTIQDFVALNENAEFNAASRSLLAAFPDFAPAREALGYQRYDGAWLNEAEVQRAKGRVFHDGAWIPQAEAEARIAAVEQQREERQRQRDLRRAQRELQAQARHIERVQGNSGNFVYFRSTHPFDQSYGHHRSAFARYEHPWRSPGVTCPLGLQWSWTYP